MRLKRYLIHTEKIWDENTWKNLLNFLRKNGKNTHIFLMPPQYEYQYSVLGFRGSRNDLNNILKSRCKELKELQKKYQFLVGLHLHVSIHCKTLSNKIKTDLLENGFDWLSKFFNIQGIVFGWYKYDEHLKKICSEKNLEILHYNFFSFNLHDYDLPPTKKRLIEEWLRAFLRQLK